MKLATNYLYFNLAEGNQSLLKLISIFAVYSKQLPGIMNYLPIFLAVNFSLSLVSIFGFLFVTAIYDCH